jgi:hypothetical protein
MAVIINDFEVVVEQPPASNPPAGGQSQDRQQREQFVAPSPHDIELINRHFKKRNARLLAD